MRKKNATLTALGVIALVGLIAMSAVSFGLSGIAIHSLVVGNFALMWKCLGGLALTTVVDFVCIVFVGAAFSKN